MQDRIVREPPHRLTLQVMPKGALILLTELAAVFGRAFRTAIDAVSTGGKCARWPTKTGRLAGGLVIHIKLAVSAIAGGDPRMQEPQTHALDQFFKSVSGTISAR